MSDRVAVDPHHENACEWRWDGRKLWHRARGVSKWVEVKRVHPTPARISMLNALINGKDNSHE